MHVSLYFGPARMMEYKSTILHFVFHLSFTNYNLLCVIFTLFLK